MDQPTILSLLGIAGTIIATIITCSTFLYKEIKEVQNELKTDIKIQIDRSDRMQANFYDQIKEQSARSDKMQANFSDQIKVQSARADKLYENFCDLLNKRYNE